MYIFQPLAIIKKDEDGRYNALSPNVKGAISYGGTYEEAVSNITEAIEGIMESALENGYNGVLLEMEHGCDENKELVAIPIKRRLRVAATIHLVRERAGMNQEEFSQKLGINRETVCRYERGKRMPSADTFLTIIEAV